MANFGYYPNYYTQASYNPVQLANQIQAPQQNPNSSIIWVQGETGAKSYLVGAGQSVLLMDSESSAFYIKSTDASGMPLPLRVFDYKERAIQEQAQEKSSGLDISACITREEFKQWADDFMESLRKEEDHGEKSAL